jgi:hypothetical protein
MGTIHAVSNEYSLYFSSEIYLQKLVMTSDGGFMSSVKRGDCQMSKTEHSLLLMHYMFYIDVQSPTLVSTYPFIVNSVLCRHKYAFT